MARDCRAEFGEQGVGKTEGGGSIERVFVPV